MRRVLVLALFASGCAINAGPILQPRTVTVAVSDGTGPVVGAAVVLDASDPTGVHNGATEADGVARLALVPPRWINAQLTVTKAGCDPYGQSVVLPFAKDAPLSVTLHCPPPAPVHVDPTSFTDAQLRAVKTDIAGVYLDEIKPQCPEDPVTHIRCISDEGAHPQGIADGILFTANYRLYPADRRKVIRDVFTGKRPDKFGLFHHYTHYAISLFCRDVPDYHGIYPDCAHHAQVGLNDALRELIDDGLIPIGFAMHDDEPDDLGTPLSIAGVVDPSLVPLVSPYWEHYEVDCATEKVRSLFPRALLYYHNPVNTDAGYPDACYAGTDAVYGALGGALGWWRHFRDAYGGRGALIQNGQGSVQDVIDRLADFTARFGAGYHGWPTGLDAVWFEDTNTVYDNFWGGGDEAANVKRADQVLSAQPYCVEGACGSLAGYGSGGTVR